MNKGPNILIIRVYITPNACVVEQFSLEEVNCTPENIQLEADQKKHNNDN